MSQPKIRVWDNLKTATFWSSNGHQIIVDTAFLHLTKYRYWARIQNGFVAEVYRSTRVKGKQKTIRLAHEVIGAKKGMYIDHINRNPLDNRKKNLRHVTPQQNCFNQGPGRNKKESPYRGVGVKKTRKPYWVARICMNGNRENLGKFRTAELAAIAWNKRARELYGMHAYQNPIPWNDLLKDGGE